jgi:HAE1 family hydrophobic/amphiphilic exporter-1
VEAHQSGLNINLYVQIGFVLLVALSAKNAILIVEFARELRAAGRPILEAATEAARARFRPIVMTSFAFILGVVPLVLAIGASARTSIGITVFTGMIASTCLAVLFVPPFFAVAQHIEEWRKPRKSPSPARRPAE